MTTRGHTRFEGRVWRHVPAEAFALHVGFILRAHGRWNRPGRYGCLYTAATREGAIAEYRKALTKMGLTRSPMVRDLVSLDVSVEPVLDLTSVSIRRRLRVSIDTLRSDDSEALESCLSLADYARAEGYGAILTPSAALKSATNLAIYIDGRADRLQLDAGPDRETLPREILSLSR